MNDYLDVSEEVADALAGGVPVVALESTIISHGMPWPRNAETALEVEAAVRSAGAVPRSTCWESADSLLPKSAAVTWAVSWRPAATALRPWPPP